MANYYHWQYPAKAEPVFVPAVVVPPMDSWFAQLSQPLVLPPVPATEGEAFQTIDPANFPPSVTSWFVPLSLPVLPPPRPVEGQAQLAIDATTFPPLVSTWFRQLSAPLLVRPTPATEGQGQLAIDPATFPAAAPSMDSWFRQLSAPLVLAPTPPTEGIPGTQIFETGTETRPSPTFSSRPASMFSSPRSIGTHSIHFGPQIGPLHFPQKPRTLPLPGFTCQCIPQWTHWSVSSSMILSGPVITA